MRTFNEAAMTTKPTDIGKRRAKPPSATICNSPGCDREILARGYCRAHYYHMARGRNPDEPVRSYGRTLIDIIIRIPPELVAAIDIEGERNNVTRYEICRRMAQDWYETWVAKNGAPPNGRVQALIMRRKSQKAKTGR